MSHAQKVDLLTWILLNPWLTCLIVIIGTGLFLHLVLVAEARMQRWERKQDELRSNHR